jgi:hypothetical protein
MNKAKDIFEVLLRIANANGTVKSAHLYSEDFITIEGESAEGKKFTFSFREEEKDA